MILTILNSPKISLGAGVVVGWKFVEIYKMLNPISVKRTNRLHYLLSIYMTINLYIFRADLMLIIRRYQSLYTAAGTGVLISPQPDQEGNKLQREKILSFIYPIHNHNWRNINTIYVYITRLIKEIFSPSNKIHGQVGRAKDLSAPLYVSCVHVDWLLAGSRSCQQPVSIKSAGIYSQFYTFGFSASLLTFSLSLSGMLPTLANLSTRNCLTYGLLFPNFE